MREPVDTGAKDPHAVTELSAGSGAQARSAWEQAAIATSVILVCWLLIDSWVLERVQALDPEARRFFQTVTELGRPRWALIGAGLAIIVVFILRRRDAGETSRRVTRLGRTLSAMIFFFLSVAGSGAIAALAYGIIGRARPKLHDLVGPIEFRPMSFHPDYSSFPSHHATTVFAIATVVALLAPRWRVIAYLVAAWFAATRFLIGTHYLSDTVAGAAIGILFTTWLAVRFAARGILFERDAGGRLMLPPLVDARRDEEPPLVGETRGAPDTRPER